ncbi:GAP family protein [Mycobacteroides abscessus]|uniref:GAP family protein n=1 Tax=Mycobacteroides abscessus TaxID=36809 RepID=UPI00092678F5|nr:GAP family protein [Mycobacteroides abscessus]SHP22461.1 Protein of uncharacterised function (DUF2910) [Mycobacteroides abscessus subsp. abscessus]
MLALLIALAGWAFLDSLNVLNVALVSAVICDSRLGRRSPLEGGLSFIAGLFGAITVVGLCAVLGLSLLGEVVDIHLTPSVRYWGALVLGVVLVVLASFPSAAASTVPWWAIDVVRQRPWVLAVVGAVVGLGQAPTSIPYVAGLAMLSAHKPLPELWWLIVAGYCAITVWPLVTVLALSMRRTVRARRVQRRLVRILVCYGPPMVRALFLLAGIALMGDAVVHYRALW